MYKDKYDDEIYELREKKMSYNEISNYFKNKGIPLSVSFIYSRCAIIYMQKEKKQPVALTGAHKDELGNEEIFKLREQGLRYDDIVEYFKQKGIKTSKETIRLRCKKIYEQKGKKEPKAKRRERDKKINLISDEELYMLKEKGYTYKQISDYYKEKGIIIGYTVIRKKM